jgi:hypothetical protein
MIVAMELVTSRLLLREFGESDREERLAFAAVSPAR